MSVAPKSRMRRAGFTLVELAMVLAIFAFVVGGILAAASLTRDAQLRNTAKELAQLRRAVQIYQERYSSFPGDTSEASGLFGCSGCNGNGNGRIDRVDENPTQALLEQRLFWEHLSRADLIKYSLRASNRTIGKLYPPSSAADGAAITIEGRKPDRVVAIIHLVQIGASGSVTEPGGGVAPLTPEEAERIDRMIDDGSPGNGQMVAENSTGGATDICRDASTGGYAANVGKRCNATFLLAGRNFLNAKSSALECQWTVRPLSTSGGSTQWKINAINGSAGTTYNSGTPDMGFSSCSQPCGDGVQTRAVSCGDPTAAGTLTLDVSCTNVAGTATCAASDCQAPVPASTRPFRGCTGTPPPSQKACNLGACANGWTPGPWSDCKAGDGTTINYGDWELSDWGDCSKSCGTGNQYRTATCHSRVGVRTRTLTCANPPCDEATKPATTDSCIVNNCGAAPTTTQTCNEQPCNSWVAGAWSACSPPPVWSPGAWSACDSDCGAGLQTRGVSCNVSGSTQTRSVTCPAGATCNPADKPATSKTCSSGCAGARPPEVQSCMGGTDWGDIFNSNSHIYRTSSDSTGWTGCIAN